MQARKVVTRSGRTFRTLYPSRKMGRMVGCESLLERDCIQVMEFSPGIKSYREQPELIHYRDGDTLRRYFPDFEVVGNSGEVFHIEVKPEGQLSRPDIARKLHLVAEHYAKRGMGYRILTEKTIRAEPLYSNLKHLRRYYRDDEVMSTVLPDVRAMLTKASVTLDQLSAMVGSTMAFRLIAHGLVGCDLQAPLSSDARIFHSKEIDHDQVLF